MYYDGVAKTLHWAIVTLLVMQFPLAWTMPDIPPGQMPEALARLHLSFGLVILAVMLVRLCWRLTHPPPPLPVGVEGWQIFGSQLVHGALYVLLIAAPIAGWTWASAKGWPIIVFGAVRLPPLVVAGSPWRPSAAAVHQYLAWAILVLVGLHVAAAAYHQFLRRDDVVSRMLPRSE
jgi:cytochrome b561